MRTFPLSSKAIAALATAIDSGYTAREMTTLFLSAEADAFEPENPPNKLTRAHDVIKGLRTTDTAETGASALELVRLVLAHGKPDLVAGTASKPSSWWPPLVSAVEADGWEFDTDTDTLVPAVPGIAAAEEANWLVKELRTRGMDDAAGHYEQAIEAFATGHWASANAQLRSYFEALIPDLATLPPSSSSGRVHRGFDRLDADGHLLDHEASFGKALWKMLHPNGSHPGLSDHDEARFRLLTLTGYTRFLISRHPP